MATPGDNPHKFQALSAPGGRPFVMVAPNGARRGKKDHPEIPMTVEEIAITAASCQKAGADAMHAHVRDSAGKHALDAGLFSELISETALRAPGMIVQATTESAGRYTPAEQRRFLAELRPAHASVSVAEMLSDGDMEEARRAYFRAADDNVSIQHIVYGPRDVRKLAEMAESGMIPGGELSALLVLGSYAPPLDASPSMLQPFLDACGALPPGTRLMACAFGRGETACMLAAAEADCDCRVGFENNLLHPDGSVARDNAERVAEVVDAFSGHQAGEAV